ncbi:ankyrin repeat domain-containing protein [Wolbachia endosymbiont of Pentidionis agamae]|uniref:ankyrin repeat domain-containing protein n=1 Tax=Wolbachia endosymbiont of Pentidionis agamae TaxID=3110435 RepID=UPI002FD2C83B
MSNSNQELLNKKLFSLIFTPNKENFNADSHDMDLPDCVYEEALSETLKTAGLSIDSKTLEELIDLGYVLSTSEGISDATKFAYHELLACKLLTQEEKQVMAMEKLIDKGADVNAFYGASTEYPQGYCKQTPLHRVFIDGNGSEKMVELLIEKGANVNAKDCMGRVSLHYAAEQEDKEAIKFLVKNCADLSIKEESGYTPLDVALGYTSNGEHIEYKNKDICKVIKEAISERPQECNQDMSYVNDQLAYCLQHDHLPNDDGLL